MVKLARGAIMVCLAAVVLAAQVPSLTGTWKLNPDKSKWGKKPKPTGVMLTIQHDEPRLTIKGTVADDREESGGFHFDGTIGGPPVSGAEGTLRVRRIDARTIESAWKSNDGRYSETGRTTLSRDGKELTREVDLKRPEGEMKWTEVYDKQ